MKKIIYLLSALVSLQALNARASALVWKDEEAKQIHVIARMHYFGPHISFQELKNVSKAATDEISRMWNEPKAEVVIDGVTYDVQFEIMTKKNTPLLSRRINEALVGSSCADNFINIFPPVKPRIPSSYGELSRMGAFYIGDDIGESTTAAHEFGHGLGLVHSDFDQRNAPVPGIMFARGTFVRPEFQLDPTAHIWEANGKINPALRHVRREDVADVHLERLKFNEKGLACVGDGTITN